MVNTLRLAYINSDQEINGQECALYIELDSHEQMLIPTRELCFDCSTPLIFIRENDNRKFTHAKLYHDRKCSRVRNSPRPVLVIEAWEKEQLDDFRDECLLLIASAEMHAEVDA
jgi:hypothetical protein